MWMKEAKAKGLPVLVNKPEPECWSTQDKFLFVVEIASLTETELAQYFSSKGIEEASYSKLSAFITLGTGLHAIQDMHAHNDKRVDNFNMLFVIDSVCVVRIITMYHHRGAKGGKADKWDKEHPDTRVIAAQNAMYDYLNRFIEGVDYH